jgi:hypothetical protein
MTGYAIMAHTQAQKKHVTPRMMQNIWYIEQNLWGRIDCLSRSQEETFPNLRQQVEELAQVYNDYLSRWKELQDARAKDGVFVPDAGLLTPLRPVFKMTA